MFTALVSYALFLHHRTYSFGLRTRGIVQFSCRDILVKQEGNLLTFPEIMNSKLTKIKLNQKQIYANGIVHFVVQLEKLPDLWPYINSIMTYKGKSWRGKLFIHTGALSDVKKD